MFLKPVQIGLVGCAIVSVVTALPSNVLNATLSRPPTTVNESMTFCNAVGRGDSPVPKWFWKQLQKGFTTTTDIFASSHKIRFARFVDDVCGLCPEFPKQPEHYQVGNVDKLASARCKDFESEQVWNSFMFEYGSKLSECRIDVFHQAHCVGPIIHSYESNAEHHCQAIPEGGKSVHVQCSKAHNQVEFLRWPIDEVRTCPAIDQSADDNTADQQEIPPHQAMSRDEPSVPSLLSHPASLMDFHSDDDATSLSDLVTTSRIKTVVRQEYDVVPNNGTSFAYFEQRDCGSCGSSSEEGTAMLLTSGQCQTLPSNFTSFFFKFGDSVQTVNLQVFNQAACVGEAETFDEWDARQCQIVDDGAFGMSVKVIFNSVADEPKM